MIQSDHCINSFPPFLGQSWKWARSNPSEWPACRSGTPHRRPHPARALASHLQTGRRGRGAQWRRINTRGIASEINRHRSANNLPRPFCGAGDRNSVRYWKYGFSVVISKYRIFPSPCRMCPLHHSIERELQFQPCHLFFFYLKHFENSLIWSGALHCISNCGADDTAPLTVVSCLSMSVQERVRNALKILCDWMRHNGLWASFPVKLSTKDCQLEQSKSTFWRHTLYED